MSDDVTAEPPTNGRLNT